MAKKVLLVSTSAGQMGEHPTGLWISELAEPYTVFTKAGFDVTLYEKTGQFARFGGPIQFASNALSTLKATDARLFERVMEKFTFTGTRRCGIKDGLRADGTAY